MKLRFCVLPVCLAAGAALASDVRIIEQVVAKVNGEIVTASELARNRRLLEGELKQQGLTGVKLQTELAQREKDLLRDRIDSMLLVQKAKELDINVDSEVTKQLADIQRNFKIADQDKFHDFVREQSGMQFEDYRQQMREELLKRRLIGEQVGSKITVPHSDVEKYYKEHQDEFVREERVFLSEILISTAGKEEKEIPALEKKAKSLVERARNGEKFPELARDNSDSDSAKDMGQLGPAARKDLQAKIADLVFSQQRGYVSDPIRAQNGFLILRVDDKHTAGLAPLEEVDNEITQKLYQPLYEPSIRNYLTTLRKDAFLEIREGYLDSGAAPGKDTSWQNAAQLKPQTVSKEEVASVVHTKRILWMIPLPFAGTGEKVKATKK
jgi:parvulin-like peptidyl-prolyl isomerase